MTIHQYREADNAYEKKRLEVEQIKPIDLTCHIANYRINNTIQIGDGVYTIEHIIELRDWLISLNLEEALNLENIDGTS